MTGRYSRRRALQLVGGAASLGIAGCTDGGEPDGTGAAGDSVGGSGSGGGSTGIGQLPADLRAELPDPEPYVPENAARLERRDFEFRIDTGEGRLVAEMLDATAASAVAGALLADDVEATDSWEGDVDAATGNFGTGVYNGEFELTFAPDSLTGFAIRATAAADVFVDGEQVASDARTVRYHADVGRFSLPPIGGASGGVSATLRRDLHDPEALVVGRDAEKERESARFFVADEEGLAVLVGGGTDSVTAIDGYLVAEGLEAKDGWYGVADPFTDRIGTTVVVSSKSVLFEPGTFEGVALRATAGVQLEHGGETIVEDASLVRYHAEDGVIEER